MALPTVQEALYEAHKQGFSWAQSAVVVAILLQESGLGKNQNGPTTAGNDKHTGYAQWSSVYHPEVYATPNCIGNLSCELAAMHRVSGGSDFHQWEAFTTGAYLKWLVNNVMPVASTDQTIWGNLNRSELSALTHGNAEKPGGSFGATSNDPIGSGLLSGVPNPLDTLTSWGDAIVKLVNKLTSADTWQRIGLGTLGLMLVAGGLIVVILPHAAPVIQQAAKTAEVAE